MSGSVRIEQTDTGYKVVVKDAETVVIVTDDHRIGVSFDPDDDDATPLDVALE